MHQEMRDGGDDVILGGGEALQTERYDEMLTLAAEQHRTASLNKIKTGLSYASTCA